MYTDIHSHVIWGVDDGANSKEETFRLLREAVRDGIGQIICTPHMAPGIREFPAERFRENFRTAEEYIRQEGMRLRLFPGAEILYTDHTPRLLRERQAATMAGTAYVLIEFNQKDSRQYIYDALRKVSGNGFIPIIAHIERYPAICRTECVREMRLSFRAMIQMNAGTLTGRLPPLRKRFIDGIFREGLVDFVATDTHGRSGRETCMTAGMRAVEERYGRLTAQRIAENPNTLLEG